MVPNPVPNPLGLVAAFWPNEPKPVVVEVEGWPNAFVAVFDDGVFDPKGPVPKPPPVDAVLVPAIIL